MGFGDWMLLTLAGLLVAQSGMLLWAVKRVLALEMDLRAICTEMVSLVPGEPSTAASRNLDLGGADTSRPHVSFTEV